MEKSILSGLYLELLRAWPNRWLGVFISAAIVAVIAVVVTAMPDLYASRASIYINSQAILGPLLTGITPESDPDDRIKMLKVLQATVLNEKNLDRMIGVPDIGFDISTAGARSRAARQIRAGVTIVEQEADENLFELSYTDTNPARAHNVAKALLAVLLDTNSGQTQAGYDDARKFLDVQIQGYQAKLQELETQITDFRLTNVNLLGATTHQQRLAVALTALRDAQLARQIATGNRDRVKTQMESGARTGGGSASAILATDQTFPAAIDRLSALQTQLDTLLLQFTDKHPDVLATKREIVLLTEQYGLGQNLGAVAKPFTALPGQVPPSQAIDAAVGPILPLGQQSTSSGNGAPTMTSTPIAAGETNVAQMQLVRANFAVMDAERKVRDATAAVHAIDVQSKTAPTAEAELDQLTRDYAVVKENYEQLVRRRETAKITQAADLSTGIEQFRIIEPPNLPGGPSSPDRPTILLLGALVAVLAGGALAYGLSLFRGTFVSAAEAEQALGLPVIARLTYTQGLVTRVAYATDAMMLLGAILGIFAFAYVLSATSSWAVPIRGQIYRFLEVDLGRLLGLLQ